MQHLNKSRFEPFSLRVAGALATVVALTIGANGRPAWAQEAAPYTGPGVFSTFASPGALTSAGANTSLSAEGSSSSSPAVPIMAEAVLPDAPSPQTEQNQTATVHGAPGSHIAPVHSEYVPAGWSAPRLTARDKVVAGAEDVYSLDSVAGIVISAGYEYVVNSSPNYSPSDAFGKRLGAAAIRDTTETVFSEVVLAPLLHEDPRYYQKGDGHGFFPRAVYAITRPLVTRTDGGHETVNGALLLGYAGATALTPLYYPPINRNFHDAAATYGGSIGGAALGDLVSEFSDDVLEALHLKRPLK